MVAFNDGSGLTKERFAQLNNTGLPFNPVATEEVLGANLGRLQKVMAMNKLKDPRFVSAEEAKQNGWEISPKAESVQINVSDPRNRSVIKKVKLFNAFYVKGMPTMAEMLAMSDDELAVMQGLKIDEDALELFESPIEKRKPSVNELEPENIEPKVKQFEHIGGASTLLNGQFVRDQSGGYRPAAGGRAVLVDKGDSLVLKTKSPEAYDAAMQLAKNKGWTSIEVKGNAARKSDAWLAAKMAGLEVTNYEPSKADQARMEQRQKEAAKALAEAEIEKDTIEVVRSPERVLMQEVQCADGLHKTAVTTYTVEWEQEGDKNELKTHDAVRAAKVFETLPPESHARVMRSTTCLGGAVEPGLIVADSVLDLKTNVVNKIIEEELDMEFAHAYEAAKSIKSIEAGSHEAAGLAGPGRYSGNVVAVDLAGGRVLQKIGRDPEKVIWHDLSKFAEIPKEGATLDITHGKDGLYTVKDQGLARTVELAR